MMSVNLILKKSTTAGRLLISRPRYFLRLVDFKLSRVLHRSPVVRKINGIRFEFDFALDPAVKGMLLREYEPDVVDTMKRLLHKGDTFIDVGANIGYLSAIAAGLVGVTGQVHCFEPVPSFFQKLGKMASINKDYRIIPNQVAIGEHAGATEICVTNRPNIGWNTMVPNFMPINLVANTFEVSVCRLDDYISENRIENISLIKIDVEGYEFHVLRGLKNYFETVEQKPAIICEIQPGAYHLLGHSLHELAVFMKYYGYSAHRVGSLKEVELASLSRQEDVIFLPHSTLS